MSADFDDLDDLLRTAMKSLDAYTPPGYFDTLPGQAVARLEADMQQSSTSGNREAPSTGVPPIGGEEDSGLHDIRSLAQTAKQRISSRRESTQPPVSNDELLASSSASWKNLALPQPAKMVSLPELDQLPSKAEIKAQAKAARVAAAAAPAAAAEPSVAASTPALAPRPAFAPRSQPSHKGRNLALAGMGLAAAAGIGLFVMSEKNGDVAQQAAPTAKAAAPVAAATPTVQPIAEPAPAAPVAADNAAAPGAVAATGAVGGAATPIEAPAAAPPAKVASTRHATKAPARRGVEIAKAEPPAPAPVPAETRAPEPASKKKAGDAGDPSFDALLKEAGVNEQQKVAKPVLDKKELSGDDFKKGMSAITARAQACYKSTQGTATVKLVIAPSGKVARVTIGGVFTGKPEAACVAAAVKSATFPPWDGGSQSMGYSFLLSE